MNRQRGACSWARRRVSTSAGARMIDTAKAETAVCESRPSMPSRNVSADGRPSLVGAVGAMVGFAGFAVAVVAAPDATARWTAKEAAIEHISHVVLVVAVGAWTVHALARGRWTRPRRLASLIAAWCLVVLGEEVQWGAVYELDGIAAPLAAVVGRPDLHNAWAGASYMLFGLPVVALVVFGWRAPAARLPDRGDSAALLVVMGVSLVGTLCFPSIEAQLDEVSELVLYSALVWMAARRRADDPPRRSVRTQPGSSCRRPR